MAQQVKALTAKADDLRVIPETQRVEGENQFPQVHFDLHPCTVAHAFVCTHIQIDKYNTTFVERSRASV